MKKTRIVIASVLKPVDDARLYEKIGCSLAREGYDVFLLGFPSRRDPEDASEVVRVPHAVHFRRLSLWRFLTPVRVAVRVLRLKPRLLVVCTHELLDIAILCKILIGVKIIYDIEENYYANALYAGSFRGGMRRLLAWLIRVREMWWSRWCDAFLVAEGGYTVELPFLHRAPAVVIQNKLSNFWIGRFPPKTVRGFRKLLFTGTLSETTGVFAAVELAKGLHALDPSVELTIAGYCARKAEFARLCIEVNSNSFIVLKGGDQLLPHGEIIRLIHASDFGLVLYKMNPAFSSSIPTKLYEYMGLGLPVLAENGFIWGDLIKDARAGILLDDDPDFGRLLEEMRSGAYYPRACGEQVMWSSEAPRLAEIVRRVLTVHSP